MFISVDSGKENTKCFCNNKLSIFKTKISEGEEVIKGVDTNSYNIIIDNVLYKVGDTAKDNSYEVSKNIPLHKVCILTAIARHITRSYESIELVTGTPVNLFYSSERDNIRDSMLGSYTIIFNGEIKRFSINKVLVVPEGMGVIYNNFSYYKDKLIKVVDIGGLNINGCIYKNGLPVKESIFTLNGGVNILINNIMNALNKEGYNYQNYEVSFLLNSNTKSNIEEEIIGEVIDTTLNSIRQILQRNNWNVDTGDLLFTGGGSELLKDKILNTFTNAVVSPTGLKDNVLGFYNIGGSML